MFGWAPRAVLSLALMALVHRRLGVVFDRLDRLMVRFQAGKPVRRVASPVVVAPVVVAPGEKVSACVPSVTVVPRPAGWLLDALGDQRHQAAWFSAALEGILREPAWVALLAAAPQARRLLRPVCRMLAVDPGVLDPMKADAARPAPVRARIRAKAAPLELGRIALPRGVLAWARRERRRGGFEPG